MFDTRVYCKDMDDADFAFEQPFEISREAFQKRILESTTQEDSRRRLEQWDPILSGLLKKWVSVGGNQKEPAFRRKYNVMASEIAMVELSDLMTQTRFINVVRIGVSYEYQRLGVASAVIDYILWLTHQPMKHSYKQVVIESVVSKGLHMLLQQRSDCSPNHNNYIFVIA